MYPRVAWQPPCWDEHQGSNGVGNAASWFSSASISESNGWTVDSPFRIAINETPLQIDIGTSICKLTLAWENAARPLVYVPCH